MKDEETVVTELLSGVDSVQGAGRVIEPAAWVRENAWVGSMEQYNEMYDRSVADPDGFWADMATDLVYWEKPWDKVLRWEFDTPKIEWFIGGRTNAAYNCLDRHLTDGRRNKAAIIWESDDGRSEVFTYQSLYYKVCRLANVLKKRGIKKGDRVAIYMPMIPELAVAMLACARIGAIHSIVFGGFSPHALHGRIEDSGCKMLITTDEGVRGGRTVPLKVMADEALLGCPTVETCIVVARTGNQVEMMPGRDFWYHDEVNASDIGRHCDVEWMDSEDPLFILYTSGSTGKPKGVLHTTGGYLVYTTMTFKYTFDYHEDDVFFCTADIGWITGHSYVVYGALSLGGTSVMFEGVPTYPDAGRFWELVDKHGINQFYTAPTAIRALMKAGEEWPAKYDLSSLRVLGTVGEPISPDAWMWYYKNVGRERIPVVDTWWQTETGGHMITSLPGATPMKPGSATLPMFGVQPIIFNEDKTETPVNTGGRLCFKFPWPGMLRGTWGDLTNSRMKDVYFSQFPGYFFSGDGCRMDEDGYYWLTGRIDDVINVSGHRLGTAEIESALGSHPFVAESAVVGFPHDVKGEGIYAYVILKGGVDVSDDTISTLRAHVRSEIGPIATPDHIQIVPDLPKTRSGKIMRRIVRKIAAGEREASSFGDTSTLADPLVVDRILEGARDVK